MMNAHSALFQLPLIREMCIALNFRAASRDVGADGGSSVAVFPGGGLEMQRQRAGQDTVVLRRGFVSLAIERGLPIVPVYLCNETSAFVPLARFARLREWLYDLTKAGVPLWTGLGGLPLCPLPNRERYLCVIGEPIPVGAARAPSAREVDDVLADVELGMRRLHGKFAPLAGRAPGHAIVFDRSRL
jgi:1-acyl-sn-glycerol-3-phosphate acyltransferase